MQKILIIEDDKFLGDVLLQKLISDGFDTKLIKDGNLAINEIKEFQPDLILLDILLPNFNGYEILEEKQKDESIKDIPVIILSNSGLLTSEKAIVSSMFFRLSPLNKLMFCSQRL